MIFGTFTACGSSGSSSDTSASTENTQTSSYTYTMKAPLDLFVIDKKLEGCSSPAYTKPKYSPCGDSAASTVLASFVLIIASIMFALL